MNNERSTPLQGVSLWQAVWGLLALTLAYLLAYCDRTIVTILVGPFKQDLGFSDSQVGLLIGFSFAIFYSVAGLPLGRITDRFNRRNLIIAGILTWSAATAACGLVNRLPGLFVARVCVGAGEACLVPAALSMIADYFGPRGRSKAVALFVCGAPLGQGMAYLLGGALLTRFAQLGVPQPLAGLTRFPWQCIFLLLGMLGLLAVVLLSLIREPPRLHPDAAHDPGQRNDSLKALMAHHRPLLLGLILGPAIMSIAFYALLAWGPTMMSRRFGWTAADIALWFPPLGILSGLLGPWLAAWLGTRLTRSGRPDGLLRAVVHLGLMAGPAAIIALTTPIAAIAVALMFVTTGLMIAVITVPQVAIQYIMPGQVRGQVTALFVFCANIIGFGLGPNIVAAVTDYGFRQDARLNLSLAIVCTVALLLGGTLTLLRLPHYRRYVTARGCEI